ncbi:unnamed protein product, partial [Meganyctiphanes norvegica]
MGDNKDQAMAWYTKLAYGVGHFFNDLAASMWFTYLLIFLIEVIQFSGVEAGIILLVGQLADGIATPVVGMLCDRRVNNAFIAKYGRRKTWHAGGTLLMTLTYPFIWNNCLGGDADRGALMVYYCFFSITVQFGWAMVQISHLALIPDLTTLKKQRTELSSIRYAFTVIANLSVYTVLFFVFDSDNCTDEGDGGNQTAIYNTEGTDFTTDLPTTIESNCSGLGPEDSSKFATVSLVCLGIGLVFSLLFHLGVHEKPYTTNNNQECTNSETRSSAKKAMKKSEWFKEIPIYQVAALYMATRLYVNMYQSYIVLYTQDTLDLPKNTVATVPFVMYCASFVTSFGMVFINGKIGSKATFTVGCLVGLSGCVWVALDRSEQFNIWGIYLVASLLGIGGSTLLITSIAITADLIGDNDDSGAFVYGFMSFADKVSNGIAIMTIQSIGDKKPEGSNFYQMVLTYACGLPCLLGILVIITMINRHINSRTNVKRKLRTNVKRKLISKDNRGQKKTNVKSKPMSKEKDE